MTHHAQLLIGAAEWARSLLPPDETADSLDVISLDYDRMSIADVRALIHDTAKRPLERSYRTFIITTQAILPEAQNALLKLFEEPNAHTKFYLILPREDILIPTLRSRLHLFAREDSASTHPLFETFLEMNSASRIAEIAKRTKDEDSLWMNEILSGIEAYGQRKKDAELLREILFVVSEIRQNGASKKMLLEHLALSL